MRYRGKTVAIAGVEPVSLLGNQACMWSWTGKEIEKCPVSFWKISKAILLFCRQIYPCLYAACDSRYTVAQQYLKRLGAIRHKEPLYLADKQIHFDVYQFTLQCK